MQSKYPPARFILLGIVWLSILIIPLVLVATLLCQPISKHRIEKRCEEVGRSLLCVEGTARWLSASSQCNCKLSPTIDLFYPPDWRN